MTGPWMMAKHPKRTILVFLGLTTASGACWSDDSKDVTAGATASATTAGATTTEPGTESASSTSVGTSGTSGVSSTGSSTSPTEPTTGTTGCDYFPSQRGIECDVQNNCCPAGEKCMPYADGGGSSWNATKCMPIGPSPGKPGDPCTVEGSAVSGIDSCEAGAMCWNVLGETMKGYCVGFCDGDHNNPTCAEPNTECAVTGNDVLRLCLPYCDPLIQDCPIGELCTYNDGFACALDASGDMGMFGDPCESHNACDPGLVCLDPEYVPGCQAGCCSPFCELDTVYTPIPAPAPNCPDPQMACLSWFDEGTAPPGQEKVGVCAIPP